MPTSIPRTPPRAVRHALLGGALAVAAVVAPATAQAAHGREYVPQRAPLLPGNLLVSTPPATPVTERALRPSGVVLGAGAQILQQSSAPENHQSPAAPTPVASFNVTELGDPSDKIGRTTTSAARANRRRLSAR